LDIVLTATESSAGLMCACLPLTKPVVIRFTKWVQRLRGLDTEHQGWTTVSTSTKSTSKAKDKAIKRVDDFHIQLLPMSQFTTTQSSVASSTVMEVEKPWENVGPYETKAHCEANAPRLSIDPDVTGWQMQTTWGHEKL
jgi:hypothetical protein